SSDLDNKLMKNNGEFVRTNDDISWYIQADSGHPTPLSAHSEYLNMVLDRQYGLNPVEYDTQAVISSIISHGRSLQHTSITAALSHYNTRTNSILLHTG